MCSTPNRCTSPTTSSTVHILKSNGPHVFYLVRIEYLANFRVLVFSLLLLPQQPLLPLLPLVFVFLILIVFVVLFLPIVLFQLVPLPIHRVDNLYNHTNYCFLSIFYVQLHKSVYDKCHSNPFHPILVYYYIQYQRCGEKMN
jgi:hypothetical protein